MSRLGLMREARKKAVFAACKAKGIDTDARRDLQLMVTGKAAWPT